MLSTLHIKNIGIIEDITIELDEGFNAFTGETGAGKTLIIGALEIIAGGRFSKEIIRKGENYSFIEACFYLPNNPISVDGNIIISREIYSTGRNTCKINGRLVTVTELKNFMEKIIDIHGQHENQFIMKTSEHINYVDDFIGKELAIQKEKYNNLYIEYCEVKNKLEQNYGNDTEKQRKLDLLDYQLQEIEEAQLKINEDEELERERKIFLNSEKIAESINGANNILNNNILNQLSSAIKLLEKIKDIDEKYGELVEVLKTSNYDIIEVERDLSSLQNNIEFDEERRNFIEERIDKINSLKRKYGNNIQEILDYVIQLKEEIEKIKNLEQYILELKETLIKLENEMYILSKSMSDLRNKYSVILSNQINNELADLEMPNAKIKIQLDFDETNKKFTRNGLDKIEFLISTNIGEDYKALTKIASGGEISRIVLAIKTILTDTEEKEIIVFDEIDTGISGRAAKAVAEKLQKIAQKHQVFVVTHLAVIAARAKSNFYIFKKAEKQTTKTSIIKLNEEDTIKEIARILTGEVTKTALQHAMELRYEKI